MRTQKRRRIFFVVVSIAIAMAGTLLTLLNNIDIDAYSDDLMKGLLTTGIAIALAACFTACEASFIWAHKEIEDSTRLWRKAILVVTAITLVLIMGFAAYQEMVSVRNRIAGRTDSSNFATLIKNADRRAQRNIARDAIKALTSNHEVSNIMPFAVAYVAAGISALIIGAVSERRKIRVRGAGNLLTGDPTLQARVQQNFGVNPAEARAYQDRNGKGASVWHKSRQIGYLSRDDTRDTK